MTYITKYNNGILNKYVIGDDLILSHDAVANTTSAVYEKLKTITINTLYKTPITIRIKFDLQASIVASARGKIYKNGGAVGAEKLNNGGNDNWMTFSEDLSFAEGDTLELYALTPGSANVRNFRVYGVVTQVPIAEAIVDTNIGVAAPLEGTNT